MLVEAAETAEPEGRRPLVRRRAAARAQAPPLAAGPARPGARRHRPARARAAPHLREALALVPGDERLIAATATCEHLLGRYSAAHARLRTLPEHDVALLVDAVYQPDYAALKSRAKRAVAARPRQRDGVGAARARPRRPRRALHRRGRARGGDRAGRRRPKARARRPTTSASRSTCASATRTRSATSAVPSPASSSCPRWSGSRTRSSARAGCRRRARRGRRRSTLARDAQMRSWALGAVGYTAALMGDRERAAAAAEEAVALAAGLDESFFTIAAHALAAAIFLETGQPERALEQARSTPAKLDAGRRAMLLVVRAYAELALGRTANATEHLARAAALVEKLPLAVPARHGAQRPGALPARGRRLHAPPPSSPPSTRRSRCYAADAHLIRGRALGLRRRSDRRAGAVPGAVARARRGRARAAPPRPRRPGPPAPLRPRRALRPRARDRRPRRRRAARTARSPAGCSSPRRPSRAT